MYDVLAADPCWSYRNVKTGGSHTSGAAQQYATMTLSEIASLPVRSIMAPDSVCFLWGTTPLGADPFLVLDAWGFTFKTKWYWHKIGRKGLGYWTRGEVEEVLVGVRGKVRAWRSPFGNYFEEDFVEADLRDGHVLSRRTEGHSHKPAAVYDQIDALTPGARRVELFATRHRVGWDTYGLSLDPAHDFRDPTFWSTVRDDAARDRVAFPLADGGIPRSSGTDD